MLEVNLVEVEKINGKTYFKLRVPTTGETGTYSEYSVYYAIKNNKLKVDHLSIGKNMGKVNVSTTFMFNELHKNNKDYYDYACKETSYVQEKPQKRRKYIRKNTTKTIKGSKHKGKDTAKSNEAETTKKRVTTKQKSEEYKPKDIRRYEYIVSSLPYSVEEYDKIIKDTENEISKLKVLINDPKITQNRMCKLQNRVNRLNKTLITNKSYRESLSKALSELAKYNKGAELMGLSIYTNEFLGVLDNDTIYNFEINKRRDITVYDTDVVDENSIKKRQLVMRFTYTKVKKQEARVMMGDKDRVLDLKNKVYAIHDMGVTISNSNAQKVMGALFKILGAQINIDEHDYNIIVAYNNENKEAIKALMNSTKNYKYEDICTDDSKTTGYFLLRV